MSVFPTQVGVILHQQDVTGVGSGVPHTGGGDPCFRKVA